MKARTLALVCGALILAILCTGCNVLFGGGPVRLVDFTLTKTILDLPDISVVVANEGVKTIKSFNLKVEARDIHGKKIRRFGDGDYSHIMPCPVSMEPGQRETIHWVVIGYEGAHEIRIAIDSTVDIDNNKWVADGFAEHDPRYVKSRKFSK